MVEERVRRTLLGEALKWLRENHEPRLTQEELAAVTGVAKGSIASVEAGVSQNPRGYVIAPLLAYFQMADEAAAIAAYRAHVNEGGWSPELEGRIVEEAKNKVLQELRKEQDYRMLQRRRTATGAYPLFRYLSAGNPDAAEQLPEIVDDIEPPESWIAERIGEDGYAVLVDGASMEGEGIHDGYVVWIKPCKAGEYQACDAVAALVHDGDGVWKLVVKRYDTVDGVRGLYSVPEPHKKVLTDWREYRVIGRVEAWHPRFDVGAPARRPRR